MFLVCFLAQQSVDKKYVFRINSYVLSQTHNNKISLLGLLFLSSYLGLYSCICGPDGSFIADREVYALKFHYNIFPKESSYGLFYLQSLLRSFTDNPFVLFFVVAFIFVFITLFAYNNCEMASSFSLLLLCCSQYFLYGCYQLKQAIATALVAVAMSYFFNNKYLLAASFSLLAISFHEAALFVIPLLFLMKGSKNKLYNSFAIIMLLIFTLGFGLAGPRLVSTLQTAIPFLGDQLQSYLNDSGSLELTFSPLTAIKGFPLYIISIYSLLYRDSLITDDRSNASLIVLSIFASLVTLTSMFFPWMWRFAELVYFPVMILGEKIYSIIDAKSKPLFSITVAGGFLFFTLRKVIMSYFIYGGIV